MLSDNFSADTDGSHRVCRRKATLLRRLLLSLRTGAAGAGLIAITLLVQVGVADAARAAQPNKSPSTGRIYKWVDEQGITHYGQSIPPEYRDQDAAVMNKRGLTVKRIEAAPTPEELKSLEEKAAQAKEEQKRQRAQRRRDQALMSTYSSAKEIDDARERNLMFHRQAMQGLEPRLGQSDQRLKDLKVQADTYRRTGREVPPWLQDEIGQQEATSEALRADVQRHAADIETIRARYDADKKRYIELTEARPR